MQPGWACCSLVLPEPQEDASAAPIRIPGADNPIASTKHPNRVAALEWTSGAADALLCSDTAGGLCLMRLLQEDGAASGTSAAAASLQPRWTAEAGHAQVGCLAVRQLMALLRMT